MRTRILLLAGLFLAFAQSGALAQGVLVVVNPDRPTPLPRPIPSPEPREESYRIKEINVQANVRDQVARVQVSQTFVNTGNRPIEAQFVFPLPYDGAIDSMTLMVDGTEYTAKLMPKDEARRIYEGIVRRNRDPALLEWVGTGMFQTSVFPVPAGAERKVSISYTQLLRQSQRLTDFLFPLSTAKYTSQPVESVRMRITVESQQDLRSIYSPTHTIGLERPDPRHAVVTYEGSNEIPVADFRLFYDVADGPIATSVISHRPSADEAGFFLMLASPPINPPDEISTAKNIVFVLDRSGSMEGQKIVQAREALTFVLNNLRPGDRFNIVAYDSAVESFRPELQSLTDETRAAALGFVNGLYAGGGTNIDEALKTALSQFGPDDSPSYLLFLTDGLPTVGETNEAKIVAASRQANPGQVRVISFGVGFDVNSRLLDRLTREHAGQSEYVRPDENLEVHVSRLYKKISAPVMTGVTVTVDFDEPRKVEAGPAVNRIFPRRMPDLFAGEQLVLVGRYETSGRAKVTLTGKLGGEPQSFDFPAEFVQANSGTSMAFIARLWAMRRIGEIIDELDLNGQNEELVKELLSLSTEYGILTQYTSFMADDSSRLFSRADGVRQTVESLRQLDEAGGRGGFMQRERKQALQSADRAPAAEFFDFDAAARPSASTRRAGRSNGAFGGAYEESASETTPAKGMKVVGNVSLYRRDKLWVTADTTEVDLARDADQITVVERFTPEYFALIADNTPAENQLLSSQQKDEELLIRLRGKLYHVK